MNNNYYAFWRDRYNNLAKQYGDDIQAVDYHDEITHSKFKFFILTMIGHTSKKRILDLGGGIGLISSKLSQQNFVYNLDISEEQLKQSSKKNISLIQGNAINLPFRDESFDYIICCGLIQYIPFEERSKFFEEIIRVCEQGGLIFIESPNYDSILRKFRRFFEQFNPKNIFKYTDIQKCSVNYISLAEFVNYTKEIEKCEIYSTFLVYRPLKDTVTFAREVDDAKPFFARWFCTDYTFVFKRNWFYIPFLNISEAFHVHFTID